MSAKYSDELINSYVDDELDSAEKQSLRADMKHDIELTNRVQALCNLKKSLQTSYQQIPVANYKLDKKMTFNGWTQGVAALLLLFIGSLTGWLGHSNYNGEQILSKSDRTLALNGVKLSPVNFTQPNKMVLHIATDDAGRLNRTLDKVEAIIAQYKESVLPFELEVIANGTGVNLLRADISPYKKRITDIIRKYSNVSFIVCSNSLERLRLKGIKPRLIKNTKTGVIAVEQIIKRLQQGWVYIKA